VDLADVAYELYGLAPGDFTAARNERAKQLKPDVPDLAAQVKALPKPTTAAWVVNQLVRHHGDEVEQVAQVGAALREAQDDLDRDELLALNRQRHAVLRAVTQQARALSKRLGQPVSSATADEVEQTLRAVMSDPDAAQAVRTGTLRRALSGTGFGPVDLTDAVAVPDASVGRPAGRQGAPSVPRGRGGAGGRGSGRAAADAGPPTSGTKGSTKDELAERRRQHEREQREQERLQKALAEAERQVEQADAQVASAGDTLDQAQAVVDELTDRQQGLAAELQALEQQVRDLRSRLTDVQRDVRTAERDRDQARHDAEAAHRVADRAHGNLDRLS
jgi:DNA repair exonuclease SbcCD ATPase subunit